MSASVENQAVPTPMDDVQLQAFAVSGDTPQALTFVRTESAAGALGMGLSQYLSRLAIDWDGRLIRFQKVYKVWAEPENVAVFPSAAVVMPEPAVYDSNVLTPATIRVQDGTGRYVREVAEVQLHCAVVVWTTDNTERSALTSMLEDAMDPREGTTGLRLALPFYFGAHATFEKLAVSFDDDATSTQARRRRTVFSLRGIVPQFIPVGDIVDLNARACVIVDGAE
jgi:hypothetical protein